MNINGYLNPLFVKGLSTNMKKLVNFLVLFYLASVYSELENTFSVLKTRANPEAQRKAAQDVLSRLLGSKSKLFELNLVDDSELENGGFDIFTVENNEKVHIQGPDGVSLVWGVHYYLKNYCNCHISWDGDQLNIPDELPSVRLRMGSIDKFRFYQNPCTSSYSFVWWDWKRWEREIDWMALNGINLALAFTAQEAIMQRVYDALGLPANEFTGPAFLAWNRMGNLRNFGNGLTYNWHEAQVSLQHKILKRMRELGIIPVLPGFCGVVPKSFQKIFSVANLTKMSKWNRFSQDYCCPFFLNPSDALFPLIVRLYHREYSSEFGINHVYSCDIFNENVPVSGDPENLFKISKSIYNEMRQVDPNAIWMLQGWMFLDPFWENKERAKAFLEGVPKGRLLILDLQSGLAPQFDRLNNYFGHFFIYCMLLNFGGQLGMYGYLERINNGILKARILENSTMIGIGITPEGIDQNYVMYEFTLEGAFRTAPVNLSDWISQYAVSRYGTYNKDVNEAWLILKDTAYNFRPYKLYRFGIKGVEKTTLLQGEHISKNILTKLPSLKMNEILWYNRSRIFDVFQKFIAASENENISKSELFCHDLIDVTRQTIQFAISSLYFKLINEYALNDYENFQHTSSLFLNILTELDTILGSGKNFLLGKWLEDAKSCAKNENETIIYEYNARNQVTLWGDNGEIRDYAAKQWSGLIADYYKPRWNFFIKALNQSLLNNVPINSTLMKEEIFELIEKPFSKAKKKYPREPVGKPVEVITAFHCKWGGTLYEIFKGFNNDKFEVTYF